MREPDVSAACAFCGMTAEQVTLTGRTPSSARACYDCVTLLAFKMANSPGSPRSPSNGMYATNRHAFARFLRELYLPWDPEPPERAERPKEPAKCRAAR
jgi:hypothetical protein